MISLPELLLKLRANPDLKVVINGEIAEKFWIHADALKKHPSKYVTDNAAFGFSVRYSGGFLAFSLDDLAYAEQVDGHTYSIKIWRDEGEEPVKVALSFFIMVPVCDKRLGLFS